MAKLPSSDLALTAGEAAMLYPGLSARSLNQWRRRNIIKEVGYVKKSALYRLADVEQLFASRRRLFKNKTGDDT